MKIINLIQKAKCRKCPYRVHCHDELNEIPRLNGIIRELTEQLDAYELELHETQKERDRYKEQSERMYTLIDSVCEAVFKILKH